MRAHFATAPFYIAQTDRSERQEDFAELHVASPRKRLSGLEANYCEDAMQLELRFVGLTNPSFESVAKAPLEFLRNHHHLQRLVCDSLCDLARHVGFGPQFDRVEVKSVLQYLRDHLAEHERDEDNDLRAAMIGSGIAKEKFGHVFSTLLASRHFDNVLVDRLLPDLERLAEGRALATTCFVNDALSFTERMKWRLDWEDDVVLDWATKALSGDRMAQLGERLATRRNLQPYYYRPFEPKSARQSR